MTPRSHRDCLLRTSRNKSKAIDKHSLVDEWLATVNILGHANIDMTQNVPDNLWPCAFVQPECMVR